MGCPKKGSYIAQRPNINSLVLHHFENARMENGRNPTTLSISSTNTAYTTGKTAAALPTGVTKLLGYSETYYLTIFLMFHLTYSNLNIVDIALHFYIFKVVFHPIVSNQNT